MIKGRPIDKIRWKGDIAHVNSLEIKTINKTAAPLPLTYDLMWLSDFHTEDYHDNINGKKIIKWITTKVILLVACKYPGMQMVPVIDYVPYHHVHGIPFLTSFAKKSTSNLMNENGINYVLLTLTNEQISLLPDQ